MIEKIPSQYSFSHTAKDTMAAGVVGLRDCGQQGLPPRVRTDHSTGIALAACTLPSQAHSLQV